MSPQHCSNDRMIKLLCCYNTSGGNKITDRISSLFLTYTEYADTAGEHMMPVQ